MTNTNGSYIVAWHFSKEDTGVLIVGSPTKGKMDIVNAFHGQEALDIYEKLSKRKGTDAE